VKVKKLKLPGKGKVDSYFIANDWHSYHLHEPSFKILCKAAKKIPKQQRHLIINGDFLDCEHLMKRGENFQKYIKASNGIEDYFLPETQREYEWANEMLDQLEKIFQSITFIEGNHDWRFKWFMETLSPFAYRHNFCLPTQLHLKSRNILHVNYNDWLDLGKLSITHGMYHGSTCVKKHYEAAGGRSVVFGHVHRFECRPFISRGETKQAWSLPAMCHLNPEYIKNTENNWSNGFGIAHVKSNGNFNLNVYQVWDDELVWPDGSIIKP